MRVQSVAEAFATGTETPCDFCLPRKSRHTPCAVRSPAKGLAFRGLRHTECAYYFDSLNGIGSKDRRPAFASKDKVFACIVAVAVCDRYISERVDRASSSLDVQSKYCASTIGSLSVLELRGNSP